MFKHRNLKLEGYAQVFLKLKRAGKRIYKRDIMKEVYGIYAPKFDAKQGDQTVPMCYGKMRPIWTRLFTEAIVAHKLTQLRSDTPFPFEVWAIVYGGYTYTEVFYYDYSLTIPKWKKRLGMS